MIYTFSFFRILDDIRNDISCDNLERKYLISRKDVDNIRASSKVNIRDGKKHSVDAISIDMWVQENLNSVDNCVLFYKKQDVVHDILHSEDFCLIFMNTSQKYMLKLFSCNIICIDSTHGLNSYDFELTTLLIVDEYGEGFPCACMFTNRKDTFVFQIFFEHIKEAIGESIAANVFMSDCTPVFYNAWLVVMKPCKHQLYCSWHIDRAWQMNLNKIKNAEKRKNVYKTLKVLQHVTDTDKFVESLKNFVHTLKEDVETEVFGEYFKNNYSNNFQLWATCCRKFCGINTNMYLESAHKTIKYFYLSGIKIKRLDRGLHGVLRYIRDKAIDRIIKQTKGKRTAHVQTILKRHKTSLILTYEHSFTDNTHIITNIDNGNIYHVHRINDNICCALKCEMCNICLHMFQCTCIDYYVHSTICKHIHYVSRNFYKSKLEQNIASSYTTPSKENTRSSIRDNFFQTISCNNNTEEKIYKILNDIKLKVGNERNESKLKEVLNHLNIVNSLMEISSDNDFKVQESQFGPGKKIEKQKSFYSTKLTKQKAKFLTKPNIDETKKINNFLLDSNSDHDYL